VPAVSVSCFGGLRADVDGSALDLGELKPRARQLLRLLALSAGRPRNREELVEQLWPDLDLDSGVRSLQVAVSSLRRLLRCASRSDDAQPIVRDGPSYRLAIDCVSVDIVDFEKEYSAAKEARRSGRLRDGVIHAQRALDQYQAECLPEAGAADWVTTERDRLRRLAVRAAQMVADGQLLAGDMDAAARAGERGIEIDRFDDRLWRTLITVYRRSGDRAALCRATERYAEAMSALGLPAMSAVG
jgi:DNA-binding SARP family transcriptional activator